MQRVHAEIDVKLEPQMAGTTSTIDTVKGDTDERLTELNREEQEILTNLCLFRSDPSKMIDGNGLLSL